MRYKRRDERTPHPRYSDIEVSNNGYAISYKSGKEHRLTPSDNGKGYLTVSVGTRNPRYMHRLVAETYIPNPYNLPEVNHKNGKKFDNHVANLEWSTIEHNKQHACATGLRRDLKPIEILETGEKFKSYSECARAIGGTDTGIQDCRRGRSLTHRGYHFRFFDKQASDASEKAYRGEIRKSSCCKSIIATDLNTGVERYFESITEAARCLNATSVGISDVLHNRQKKTRHYTFRYSEEGDNHDDH